MTESEQRTALYRLRFDGPLETAFRDHYEQQFVDSLGLAAHVVLVFFLAVRLGLLASGLLGPNSLFGTGLGTLALGLLLLCVYTPRLRRFVHEATGGVILSVGAAFIPFWLPYLYKIAPAETGAALQSVLLYLIVLLFFTYTLARLRFKYALLTGGALSVFYAIYVRGLLNGTFFSPTQDVSSPALLRTFGIVLVVNAMGAVAAYWTERYTRRDYLLSLLLSEERDRSERLLLNVLPGPIAERLKQAQQRNNAPHVVDSFAEVTVLFADIVDFTPLAARLSPEALVGLLNEVFSAFDALAERHGLEKIKTIGDAYMAVAGLPVLRPDHADVMAQMALDMQTEIARVGQARGLPLALRIGLNSGPVVAGVIGTKRFIYDLWGDTVNTASRMESHGEPGSIQITPTTAALLGDKYPLTPRGPVDVKGRGSMETFLLGNAA